MNAEIFTVFDMAAKRYVEPFTAPTIEVAIRSFGAACATEGHEFDKFPEDYALYHIGTFDAVEGTLKALEPRRIAMANAFVRKIEEVKSA